MSDRPEIILGEFITFNTPILNEMHQQSPEISNAVTEVIGAIAKRYGIVPGATKPEPTKKSNSLMDVMQNSYFFDSKTIGIVEIAGGLEFAFSIESISNKTLKSFEATMKIYVGKGVIFIASSRNQLITTTTAEKLRRNEDVGMSLPDFGVAYPITIPKEEFFSRVQTYSNEQGWQVNVWEEGKPTAEWFDIINFDIQESHVILTLEISDKSKSGKIRFKFAKSKFLGFLLGEKVRDVSLESSIQDDNEGRNFIKNVAIKPTEFRDSDNYSNDSKC